MSAFFEMLEPYGRYWPYGVALLAGMVLALIDRQAIGRYLFAALLVLVAIGGQIVMVASPFTFSGGDHYFQGLIASLFALAALAGYAISFLAMLVCARRCGGKAA